MANNISSAEFFLESFGQANQPLFEAWEEKVILGATLLVTLVLAIVLLVGAVWRGCSSRGAGPTRA